MRTFWRATSPLNLFQGNSVQATHPQRHSREGCGGKHAVQRSPISNMRQPRHLTMTTQVCFGGTPRAQAASGWAPAVCARDMIRHRDTLSALLFVQATAIDYLYHCLADSYWEVFLVMQLHGNIWRSFLTFQTAGFCWCMCLGTVVGHQHLEHDKAQLGDSRMIMPLVATMPSARASSGGFYGRSNIR